jgi:hypothetical protein
MTSDVDAQQRDLEARGSLELALCLLYPYVLQHDAPGERWASLLIEQTMKDVGAPWFCVEGYLEPGGAQSRHDGQFPPFQVVDLAAQSPAPGEFPTRSAAEGALRSLVLERVRLTQAQRQDLAPVSRALVQSDEYLRSIRAEVLDGSEPALGDLLESNARALAAIGVLPANDPHGAPERRTGAER